jgi:hypothetical protein
MNEQLLLDLIKKIYCRAELKQKGEWRMAARLVLSAIK